MLSCSHWLQAASLSLIHCYSSRFSLFDLIFFFLPVKGVNSSQSGEISSVTFDTEGSNVGDKVSCNLSVSPEIIDDSTEHEKEPNQSQLDAKPQSSYPDADAADETRQGCDDEKKKEVEEDIFKGSQETPDDSRDVMIEEREEQEVSQKSSSELLDPLVRRGSDITSPEPSSAANGEQTCGPVPEVGVDEKEAEQTKADVGAETQSPEEAKLKDEDTKEDHADRSCSAEADSRFAVSQHPERKKDHKWKLGCRSFSHLKVLQTAAVASL